MIINLHATADTGMAGARPQPGCIRQGQNPYNVLRIFPVDKKSVHFGENHFLDSDLQKKQLAVRAGTRVRDVVKTAISDLSFVEDNIEQLLKENEDTFEACRRFIALYERMYSQGLPYTIFEVRFTPAGHDRTLIGAGRERRSTWIDLVCNDSAGFEKYYAAAETDIKRNGARPHLGKYCVSLDRNDLERLHRESFVKFHQLVEKHDPEGKFANEFTRRLFAA